MIKYHNISLQKHSILEMSIEQNAYFLEKKLMIS